MSYRLRLILTILLVSLAPLLVVVVFGDQGIQQLKTDSINQAMQTVQIVEEEKVNQVSYDVAKQIDLYLSSHPNLNPDNSSALQADQTLASIAVQQVGITGYTGLFNKAGVVIFDKNTQYVNTNLSTLASSVPEYWSIVSHSLDGTLSNGIYVWKEPNVADQQRYIVIAPVGTTNLRLSVSVALQEWAPIQTQLSTQISERSSARRVTFSLFYILAAVGAVIASIWFGYELSASIRWMMTTANNVIRVMRNMFKNVAAPPKQDEISVISHAMGLMEKQVHDEFANLEKQIKSRTGELQQRTTQLETAAQVARESAGILNVNQLLDRAVHLISERFSFYHAGIFLVDENNEFAVLRAASSEGGQKMLARGHKLRVGQTGIVGNVASGEESRIVMDVDIDAQYYNNPDLPRTRSEMALPLRAHGRVIGVLDVQSTLPNSFQPEDVSIIQILADQIALAIENARLLEESRRSLQELQTLYGEQAYQAWKERLERKPAEFMYTSLGVEQVNLGDGNHKPKTGPLGEADPYQLIVPISIRDQQLGSIVLKRDPELKPWSKDDQTLVKDAVTQISQALENARLLEEIRLRAQSEQMMGEIAARTQSSLDLETVIKTAVREIGVTLNAARVQIRLGSKEEVLLSENGHKPDENLAEMN